MIATLVAALAGGVLAVALSVGGVAALSPSVHHQVTHDQMVKYGDNGHL